MSLNFKIYEFPMLSIKALFTIFLNNALWLASEKKLFSNSAEHN